MALSNIVFLRVSFFFVFLANCKTSQARLGDECWNTAMCNSHQLQCVNYVCMCWPEWIPSSDNTRCVVANNKVCTRVDDVCYDPNASCLGRPQTCTCNRNFTLDPESQVCLANLGSECRSDGTSCIDGSCINGRCQCGEGLSPDQYGTKCGIAVGGSCRAGGTLCADPYANCGTDNTCECREGYQRVVNSDGLTICKTSLGVRCSSSNECAATYSSCEIMLNGKGACTCEIGNVPSRDRLSCLQVTNRWQGSCQEDVQCRANFGRHSVCRNNICTCVNGYTYSSEDFGCVILVNTRAYDAAKLLTDTMLPYLPIEAQTLVNEILSTI